MIISNLVPGDVPPKVPMELPLPATQPKPKPTLTPNPPSSSSSSLRSLSMDSPVECSSFLFNGIQTTPHIPILQSQQQQQQSMDSILAQARNLQFPTPEALDEAMTRAILAVLSSPACSSSSSVHQPLEGLPQNYHLSVKASGFKKYTRVLTPNRKPSSGRQSLLKRSFAFLRNLNLMRLQERTPPTTSRPTSSQLHHVMSERRRREKLNDSFQALKSLLPPGTKVLSFNTPFDNLCILVTI